jgi:hypothetical protein
MRFPPYLLLPVAGAVLLVAAVTATTLWPEAPLPEVNVSAAPRPAPPEAAPALPAPAPRPVPRPVAARPPPVPVPPPPGQVPPPVAGASAPVRTEVAFPAPEVEPLRREAYADQKERVVAKPWEGKSLERIAQRLGEDEVRLERERQAAQMRGDASEVERLEKRIELNRKRISMMRAKFPGSFEPGTVPSSPR